MFKFLKKDNVFVGMGVAIVLAVLVYGLVQLINIVFLTDQVKLQPITESTAQLVAIVSNVFSMRYYLIKAKKDKTGRGILVVTFALSALFFGLNYL
jgi:hypothetical protein